MGLAAVCQALVRGGGGPDAVVTHAFLWVGGAGVAHFKDEEIHVHEIFPRPLVNDRSET